MTWKTTAPYAAQILHLISTQKEVTQCIEKRVYIKHLTTTAKLLMTRYYK